MKRVVFLDDLKESDIRQDAVYDEYKRLLSEDILKYFSDSSSLININCPGCLNQDYKLAFKKMGLDYRLCSNCGSIFVSPRPSPEMLMSFYKNSQSGIFFRNTYLGSDPKSRSKNVFSYRIQWVAGLVEEYLPDAKIFLDYATKYPSLLHEISDAGFFKSIISLLPMCFEQENLLPDEVKIIYKDETIEKNEIDVFSAFEVVERVFDPIGLFNLAYRVCRKGGLFLITTTTSSGFEYQLLREYSPNIIPPDRLNLLSLEALTDRIENAGFEIIEISTPGRLDVEIVKKTYERSPDIRLDSFWKYLFKNRDENALHSLQQYLQQFQLSSHVRIAAVKR